jgi:CheY-like chemotaxis protein
MSLPALLVVDDDASHRALMREFLDSLGYRTLEARDGREALEVVEREVPLAVLLDLRMPVMSGWGLLDALKKLPRMRGVPLIVISAYGFEWEAELVGAAGHVGKPVDLGRLEEVLRKTVGEPPRPALH